MRSKLWAILTYSFSKLKEKVAGTKKDKRNKGLQATVTGLLPIDHEPSTMSSRYWARKAWAKKYEGDKLELVLDKLDRDSPLSSGISTRASAFRSFIGDFYAEALKYDHTARKHQYRKLVTSEPRLNDKFEGMNSFLD